mmetsp:Transcript_18189/g.40144  ORF Transcript_18189/g.40144 Transcript_18189/m.40144 type:complete len:231 (-) Transcript_18189:171-863(-)
MALRAAAVLSFTIAATEAVLTCWASRTWASASARRVVKRRRACSTMARSAMSSASLAFSADSRREFSVSCTSRHICEYRDSAEAILVSRSLSAALSEPSNSTNPFRTPASYSSCAVSMRCVHKAVSYCRPARSWFRILSICTLRFAATAFFRSSMSAFSCTFRAAMLLANAVSLAARAFSISAARQAARARPASIHPSTMVCDAAVVVSMKTLKLSLFREVASKIAPSKS